MPVHGSSVDLVFQLPFLLRHRPLGSLYLALDLPLTLSSKRAGRRLESALRLLRLSDGLVTCLARGHLGLLFRMNQRGLFNPRFEPPNAKGSATVSPVDGWFESSSGIRACLSAASVAG